MRQNGLERTALIHWYRYNNSFNRYMVECEYKNLSALDTWKLVLIDTWWNVNKTFAKIFDELKAF